MFYYFLGFDNWIATCITPILSLAGVLLTAVIGYNKLIKQLKANNAKDNLQNLIDILKNLKSLQEAFLYAGSFFFIPSLMHRCPNLSDTDGDGKEKMSYAQLSYLLHQIGMNINENCKKIIYLTPNLETSTLCKELNNYLWKKDPGKKSHIDFMISGLITYLTGKESKQRDKFEEFQQTLQIFIEKFDAQIEQEFPLDKK